MDKTLTAEERIAIQADRIERLRKALFEARDAMRVMSNWVKKSDPAGHSWGVHMVDRANAALNGEPEPQYCDGSGAIAVSTDDWKECPVCNGSGCHPTAHKWDEDGERCEICGDKDWMPDTPCRGKQPEPRAEVTGWQPIETAQEGHLFVVGWLDPTDPEQPERHDFDWLEEGVWQRHFADYEHFITCAPAGSTGPSEEAPYTHWMPIAAIPRAARAGEGQ